MATKARKKLKVSKFDEADYLNAENCAEYLKACIEDSDGDSSVIAEALGVIARARGMGKVAKDAGLTREGLYKALNKRGNPSLDTFLRVSKALGVKLIPEAA
jgi:probable addiction module antidote protein